MAAGGTQYLDQDKAFQDLDLGLDRRLMKAISRLGYVYPTLVQSKGIPVGLAGKDLLIRARTGSGKTAAYGLVLLQKILAAKAAANVRTKGGSIRALILVPTRELVDQTANAISSLAYYCGDVISVCGLSGGSNAEQAARLSEAPDVVVATPARVVAHLSLNLGAGAGAASSSSSSAADSGLLKSTCETLIIDEADLVLSYGYQEDVRTIVSSLPRICQSMLLSATLSPQLEEMKRLVLHSPAILRLEDGNGSNTSGGPGVLTQLYVRIPRADRYLLVYALLKLRLIAGKTLIFTNDTDTCFKLKIILERFSMPAAVLNAELPANSRRHIIDQFNRGMFDLLIATDEGLEDSNASSSSAAGSGAAEDGDDADADFDAAVAAESGASCADDGNGDAGADDDADETGSAAAASSASSSATGRKRRRNEKEKKSADASSKSQKRGIDKDTEFGVSRGLDFKAVTTVVNFDFPMTTRSYTHRVGRTARGGASGVALSLMPPQGVEPIQDAVLGSLQSSQPVVPETGLPQPSPLPFDVREIEGFRYRVDDVIRSVTASVIKDARLAELRREILASEALRSHFEDRPQDLALLQHERPLAPKQVKKHLRDVPTYLLPPSLKAAVEAAGGGIAKGKGAGKKNRRGGKGRNKGANGGRPDLPASMAEAVAGASASSAAHAAAVPRITPNQAIQIAQAEVYSVRRGGAKGDPLKTFAYNANKAAAAGLGGGSGRQQRSGSGGGAKSAGGGVNPLVAMSSKR